MQPSTQSVVPPMASTTTAATSARAHQQQVEEERHAEQPHEADQVGQGEDPVAVRLLRTAVCGSPWPADATPNLPLHTARGPAPGARRRGRLGVDALSGRTGAARPGSCARLPGGPPAAHAGAGLMDLSR